MIDTEIEDDEEMAEDPNISSETGSAPVTPQPKSQSKEK
jgi:hypothetical protein